MDFVGEASSGCCTLPCLNVNLSSAAGGFFVCLFVCLIFVKGAFQVAFTSDKMKSFYFSIHYTQD